MRIFLMMLALVLVWSLVYTIGDANDKIDELELRIDSLRQANVELKAELETRPAVHYYKVFKKE